MKFSREEMQDLFHIAKRNVQCINNAIRHYGAVADTLTGKTEAQVRQVYEKRIARLNMKRKEEETWMKVYETALSKSKK